MSVDMPVTACLKRTASAPDHKSNYTILGWVWSDVAATTRSVFWIGADGNGFASDTLYFNVDNVIEIDARNNGAADIVSGSTVLTALTWYRVAKVRAGNVLKAYLNGVLEVTGNTLDISGRTTANAFRIGAQRGDANDNLDGRVVGARIYSSALTPTEILAEHRSLDFAVKASPWAAWPLPFDGAYIDNSGNGRDLTAAGAPVTGGNPNVAPVVTRRLRSLFPLQRAG